MTITVNRNISGSYVVVLMGTNIYSRDAAYIDACKHTRYPEHSFIEYVRGGQVRHRVTVHNAIAPETIMTMVRNILKGNFP